MFYVCSNSGASLAIVLTQADNLINEEMTKNGSSESLNGSFN